MKAASPTRKSARKTWLAIIVCLLAGSADTAEFRRILPIRTPFPPAASLPDGARPIAAVRPVDRAVIEQGIRALFGAYGANRGAVEQFLGENFADRESLLDNLTERIPRDARLTVLGIESAQTLNQYEMTDAASGVPVRVSTVSTVVRSQLEFNDRTAGFQRLEGRTEYLLEVRQPAR